MTSPSAFSSSSSSTSVSTSSAYHSYKVRLAIDVIKEHFGPLVSEVAALLLRSDSLTLPEIYKYFRQHAREASFSSASTSTIEPIDDPYIVRNCLLLLRRHNILIIDYKPYFSMEDTTEEKMKERDKQSKTLHYSIDLDMTLNRLRFPRVLLLVQTVVGMLGYCLMEQLLFQGQCSMKKLVHIIEELILSQPDHSEEIIEYKNMTQEELKAEIESNVKILVQKRLIIEATELPIGPKVIPPKEKEKKKRSTAVAVLDDYDDGDDNDDNDDNTRKKRKKKNASKKNKKSKIKEDEEDGHEKTYELNAYFDYQPKSSSIEVRNDVLYTVNFDEIFRRMLYDAITKLATQRVGHNGGKVIEIILNESLVYQGIPANQEALSCPMLMVQLQETFQHEEGFSSDSDEVVKAIRVLERDAVGMITRTLIHGKPAICVNVRAIVTFIQRKVKHSIAVERYGKWSGRIVELLERHSYLDQQNIGEMAIIPARDARERLYSMYRDKWVDYIEICKRTDYNPNSTYYFWYLDRCKLDTSLQESLYMSILHLRKRRISELQGSGSVSMNKSMAAAMVAGMAGNNESNDKKKEVERLSFSLDRIDQAIIQTDYTAIVLGNF